MKSLSWSWEKWYIWKSRQSWEGKLSTGQVATSMQLLWPFMELIIQPTNHHASSSTNASWWHQYSWSRNPNCSTSSTTHKGCSRSCYSKAIGVCWWMMGTERWVAILCNPWHCLLATSYPQPCTWSVPSPLLLRQPEHTPVRLGVFAIWWQHAIQVVGASQQALWWVDCEEQRNQGQESSSKSKEQRWVFCLVHQVY